jgi:2-phospho-L-lactate guanylyltransferase
MTTWAIVPVKPFHEGKSRLGDVLTDSERYKLNISCLNKTLTTLTKAASIETILVISRDAEALEIAAQNGARTLMENGSQGLNQALYQANNTLDKTHDRVLVIPTDLPLMEVEDVRQIIELGCKPPVVVVVADRKNKGTNGLFVNPVGCIRYRFGKNSSKKHVFEAQKRDIKAIVADIPGMRLDLDLEEDLEYLKSVDFSLPIPVYNSMEETIR